MITKAFAKRRAMRSSTLLAGLTLACGLGLVSTSAGATATFNASVGGVPSGADIYENFDSVPLGAGTFTTASGIMLSFGGSAAAVQSGVSGQYAPPFLSGGNGANFGGQPDGGDTTTYLTSGSTGADSASGVTLQFTALQRYLGLLWGSVDAYNTLTFYNGSTEVGQFNGNNVSSSAGTGNCANGNQGALGTCYVNISLSDGFDRVVATSSEYAFEFDNVAVSVSPLQVPEPGTVGMFLLGLLLVGTSYQLKSRKRA